MQFLLNVHLRTRTEPNWTEDSAQWKNRTELAFFCSWKEPEPNELWYLV